MNIKVSNDYFTEGFTINIPEGDTAFGGIFATPYINDSLPHYEYRKLEDSLKLIKNAIESENKSNHISGQSIGGFGVYAMIKNLDKKFYNRPNPEYKATLDSLDQLYLQLTRLSNTDSIKAKQKIIDETIWRNNLKLNTENQQEQTTAEKLYYIGIDGYALDDYSKFFIQNGTYNLAYVVFDNSKKSTYNSTQFGHYERKQIGVRYSESDKRVYIPISRIVHSIINVSVNIIFFLLLFYSIFVFLVLPTFFLIGISKGNAFTSRNILALKTISYSLLIFSVFKLFSPYILHFFFRKKIPVEMEITPFIQHVSNNMSLLFSSIAVFLIMKAFKKGYTLQQEQDLTV